MYNCTLCGPELLNCKKGSRPETSCLYSGFRRSLIEMDEIGKLELRVSLGLATCARSCSLLIVCETKRKDMRLE